MVIIHSPLYVNMIPSGNQPEYIIISISPQGKRLVDMPGFNRWSTIEISYGSGYPERRMASPRRKSLMFSLCDKYCRSPSSGGTESVNTARRNAPIQFERQSCISPGLKVAGREYSLPDRSAGFSGAGSQFGRPGRLDWNSYVDAVQERPAESLPVTPYFVRGAQAHGSAPAEIAARAGIA